MTETKHFTYVISGSDPLDRGDIALAKVLGESLAARGYEVVSGACEYGVEDTPRNSVDIPKRPA